jgi:hypothetical protein
VGDLTSCAAFPLTSLGFRNRLVAVVDANAHETPAADEKR